MSGLSVSRSPQEKAFSPTIFTTRQKPGRGMRDFFSSHIRNPNTRRAYMEAVRQFSTFCAEIDIVDLAQVEPVHVAAFVELQLKTTSRFDGGDPAGAGRRLLPQEAPFPGSPGYRARPASAPCPSRSASAAAGWRSASAPSSSWPKPCTPSPGCSRTRAKLLRKLLRWRRPHPIPEDAGEIQAMFAELERMEAERAATR